MKEVILPALEEEVNTSKQFAPLRQICYSLMLAAWFKRHVRAQIDRVSGFSVNELKDSNSSARQHVNPLMMYIDAKKTKGIDTVSKEAKEQIYHQYIEAYKKGAYNYLKKEYESASKKQVRRRYFSGGFSSGGVILPNGASIPGVYALALPKGAASLALPRISQAIQRKSAYEVPVALMAAASAVTRKRLSADGLKTGLPRVLSAQGNHRYSSDKALHNSKREKPGSSPVEVNWDALAKKKPLAASTIDADRIRKPLPVLSLLRAQQKGQFREITNKIKPASEIGKKRIFFDVGNVAILFDWARVAQEIEKRYHIPEAVFMHFINTRSSDPHNWIGRYENGKISTAQAAVFLQDWVRHHTQSREVISPEEFVELWRIIHISAVQEVVEVMRALKKAGHRIKLLTATSMAHYPDLQHIFKGIVEEEDILTSFNLHFNKRDALTFLYLGADIFIDDVAENCQAAQEAGIKGVVQFDSANLLESFEKIISAVNTGRAQFDGYVRANLESKGARLMQPSASSSASVSRIMAFNDSGNQEAMVNQIIALSQKINQGYPGKLSTFTNGPSELKKIIAQDTLGLSQIMQDARGNLLGFIVATKVSGQPRMYMRWLGVDQRYRGQHIYSRLLNACARKALSLGMSTVILRARDSNTELASMYRHYGFIGIGRQEDAQYYGSINVALTTQLIRLTEQGIRQEPAKDFFPITVPQSVPGGYAVTLQDHNILRVSFNSGELALFSDVTHVVSYGRWIYIRSLGLTKNSKPEYQCFQAGNTKLIRTVAEHDLLALPETIQRGLGFFKDADWAAKVPVVSMLPFSQTQSFEQLKKSIQPTSRIDTSSVIEPKKIYFGIGAGLLFDWGKIAEEIQGRYGVSKQRFMEFIEESHSGGTEYYFNKRYEKGYINTPEAAQLLQNWIQVHTSTKQTVTLNSREFVELWCAGYTGQIKETFEFMKALKESGHELFLLAEVSPAHLQLLADVFAGIIDARNIYTSCNQRFAMNVSEPYKRFDMDVFIDSVVEHCVTAKSAGVFAALPFDIDSQGIMKSFSIAVKVANAPKKTAAVSVPRAFQTVVENTVDVKEIRAVKDRLQDIDTAGCGIEAAETLIKDAQRTWLTKIGNVAKDHQENAKGAGPIPQDLILDAKYVIGRFIGKRDFAWEYEAVAMKTGATCIFTAVDSQTLDKECFDESEALAKKLSFLRCNAIRSDLRGLENSALVQDVGYFQWPASGGTVYYAVRDFVEGESLDNIEVSRHKITWQEAVFAALSIFRQLAMMHRQGIVYGTMRPQDIYIPKNGKNYDFARARLEGFNYSQRLGPGDRKTTKKAAFNLSSGLYASPDSVKSYVDNDDAGLYQPYGDIHAFACIVYEMLCGKQAFTADGDWMKRKTSCTFNRICDVSRKIPQGLAECIDYLISYNGVTAQGVVNWLEAGQFKKRLSQQDKERDLRGLREGLRMPWKDTVAAALRQYLTDKKSFLPFGEFNAIVESVPVSVAGENRDGVYNAVAHAVEKKNQTAASPAAYAYNQYRGGKAGTYGFEGQKTRGGIDLDTTQTDIRVHGLASPVKIKERFAHITDAAHARPNTKQYSLNPDFSGITFTILAVNKITDSAAVFASLP